MEFKWYTYKDPGLQDGFEIRREVFCKEIGFSEEFEFDSVGVAEINLGKNIISPAIVEIIAIINTPALAVSFAAFAKG